MNTKFVKSLGRNSTRYYVPELDDWIACRSLGKYLKLIGLDIQSYYDKYLLDDNENLKCPICNKNRKFINISVGHLNTCGDSNCIKELKSRSSKTTYSNPEVRKRVSEGTKKAYDNDTSINERKRTSLKLYYSNPEVRKSFSEKSKLVRLNHPEISKNHSILMKRLYKDEKFYNRRLESNRRRWENPTNRMLNSLSRKGFISVIYSPYENKWIKFDSSWERTYFYMMDNNPCTKSIIRSPISIKYIIESDNSEHYYIPDFLIEYTDGRKELVEVKPKYLLSDTIVILKQKYAELYCSENDMVYKFITEEDLCIKLKDSHTRNLRIR